VRAGKLWFVYEVAFSHAKLAVVGLDLQHVGFDEDAIYLGCDVIGQEYRRARRPGRCDEVARALVRHAYQVGAVAGQQSVHSARGVGSGVGHFAHAGLHVYQHYGIANNRLAGGFIRYCASDLGSLRKCGRKKKTRSGGGAKGT